jgi:hypothetical protein
MKYQKSSLLPKTTPIPHTIHFTTHCISTIWKRARYGQYLHEIVDSAVAAVNDEPNERRNEW